MNPQARIAPVPVAQAVNVTVTVNTGSTQPQAQARPQPQPRMARPVAAPATTLAKVASGVAQVVGLASQFFAQRNNRVARPTNCFPPMARPMPHYRQQPMPTPMGPVEQYPSESHFGGGGDWGSPEVECLVPTYCPEVEGNQEFEPDCDPTICEEQMPDYEADFPAEVECGQDWPTDCGGAMDYDPSGAMDWSGTDTTYC